MSPLPARSLSAGLAAFAFAFAALAAPAAPSARADTVHLKNGQTIQGQVEDRGAYVLVRKDLGEVRIERSEIASIELDGGAARPARELDVVVLLSGEEIAGKVRLENDGRKVIVARDVNGQENLVTYDQRQVRTILWAQGAGAAGTGNAIAASVEKLIETLRSPDAAARAQAHEQLKDLGVFALPYLEKRKPEADPAVEQALLQVVRLAKVKSYLTPAMVDAVPNLARRLVADAPGERLSALKEVVVAATADCPPLFVFLARDEKDKDVRAFLVAQLGLLGRTQELSELLDAPEGSLRLAAAVALGDNGIYLGIPIVIEALKLDDQGVRKVAIQKLEKWTGQFLGFFADDPPEKRAAAVDRWEKWWETDGKKFAADSLRATVRRDEVTEDDRQAGIAEWVRAQKAWDDIARHEPPLGPEERKAEIEKVRFLLKKSLERYPQYVNARLALGILEWAELGDAAAAERDLEDVLGRFAQDAAPLSKLIAHEQLARIARAAKRWVEADRHYRQAAAIDPRDYEVLEGLGTLCYERALHDDALAVPARKERLEEAVKVLGEAIAAIDAHELEVRESARAADAVAASAPFKRGAFLKTLDLAKGDLTRRAAEMRYQRGRALAALGKNAEAYRDYAAAAELAPENETYRGAAAAWAPSARPEPKKQAPSGPTFRPEDVPERPKDGSK